MRWPVLTATAVALIAGCAGPVLRAPPPWRRASRSPSRVVAAKTT